MSPPLTVVLLACALTSTFAATAATVDIGGRTVSKLLSDPVRPRVYALDRGEGTNRGALLSINTATDTLEAVVPLGLKPTDIDIDSTGDVLYAINFDEDTLMKVDLTRLQVVLTRSFVDPVNVFETRYTLRAGKPPLVYFSDARWAPAVHAFNMATGQELGTFDGYGEGVGGITLTHDGNTLFAWRQYGWHAGNIYSWVWRVDVRSNLFNIGSTSENYFYRDPLDTPILLSANEDRLFNKQRMLSATNFSMLLSLYEEPVYGISRHGDLVLGSTKVFNGWTGAQYTNLPFSTTIFALTRDEQQFFAFDSASTQLVAMPISQIAPVPGMAQDPRPAHFETISLPLPILRWSATPTALRYLVFLGTNQTDLAQATTNSSLYLGVTANPSFALTNALRRGVAYYWRVDVVGLNAVATGAVWRFDAVPVSVSPPALYFKAIPGGPPQTITCTMTSDGATSWVASENAPWLALDATPATLRVTVDFSALPPGTVSNGIAIVSGGSTLIVPVEVEVVEANFTQMLADFERPYVYAIQPGVGTNMGVLFCINTTIEAVESGIAIAVVPTDMAISYPERRLFVLEQQRGLVHVVDLDTRTQLAELPVSSNFDRVAAGRPGRMVLGARPTVYLYDSTNGSYPSFWSAGGQSSGILPDTMPSVLRASKPHDCSQGPSSRLSP